MSYATILMPNSGILAAYLPDHVEELNQAIGIYLITWFVFTALLLYVALSYMACNTTNPILNRIGALRKNLGFIALLFFLCITFLLLAIGAWSSTVNITKAGGGFGILTAWIAYYCGLSELLVKDESWFGLPLGTIKQARVD